MSSKSSLLVFLAIALTATSVLGHASSGLNGNAQVGRRFESEADTSDSRYVSGSQSDEIPDCTRIINARGVKKVIGSDGSVCRGPDGRLTTEENNDDRTYDEDVSEPIEGSEDGIPKTTQIDGYDDNGNAGDEEEEEVNGSDSGYYSASRRRGM